MPASNSLSLWNLTMGQGSAQSWAFILTQAGVPGGTTPYPIDPAAWQYVIRATTDDTTGSPLVSITPTSTSDGVLTITATGALSQVLLTINSAATSGLAPGTYTHALWEYPGDDSQTAWFSGNLILEQVAQP